MNEVSTSRLANGVRIVSQTLPGACSTALGIWIVNGGRHQTAGQCGYAHLLEHLLFKGTRQHSAIDLAHRFEAMGGQVNAQTGRELTALYGLCPGDQVYDLLALFSEMLLQPGFTEHSLAIERDIVFQEMALIEDSPEEAIEEQGVRCAWPAHAAGWPILGAREVLARSTAPALHDYLRGLLCGARLYVVAVGAVQHAELVQACGRLGELPPGSPPLVTAPRFTPGRRQVYRPLSQANLLWALPAPSLVSTAHPAALLTNHLLGGGTTSRLFQEIRERRGLTYDIQSRLDQYSDCGLWLIQTACDPERVAECRVTVEQVLTTLAESGPTAPELAQARAHLHAALLIDEDNAETSMERLAREAIYLQRHPTLEERVSELAAVTTQDAQTLLRQSWHEHHYLEWLPGSE